MRKMKKPPAEELRKRKEEPLAEGLQIVVPTDSRGRLWSKMSDEQIVEYAIGVLMGNEITGKKELEEKDPRLYQALYKRRLFDEIGLGNKRRSWADMGDEGIVELAKRIVANKGMVRKKELEREDNGLYQVLYRRGLFDAIRFEEKQRSWEDTDDEEIIRISRKLMEENGITGRKEFQKVDLGLYKVILKRGISVKIGFERKRRKKRPWKDVSDDEIIELAEKIMEKEGINSRIGLKKADGGVYEALRKRNLLVQIGFEYKQRSWECICDEKLLRFVKIFVKRKNIAGRHELEKRDGGLYKVLLIRGLLDEIGFKERQRSWNDMTYDEIIEFARGVIKRYMIGSRSELQGMDCGLYEALRKRDLLDRTFTRIDQQKDDQARQDVIDALEAFGTANDNNSAEDDVA